MEPIPTTMRALVAPTYTKPAGYEVMDLPVPGITAPDEILIRVHAASIQTADTQFAAGHARIVFKIPFPAILSREGSGTVAAIGSGVKSFRVGDAVYGVGVKPPMADYWEKGGGWCADYAVTTEDLLLPKPPHISFEEAAAVLGSTVTSLQTVRKAMELKPAAFPGRTLEGKTVFVTAGLGASASIALQMAETVFGAKEVITTVSTAKIPLLEKLVPGIVDQAVDYTKQDVIGEVGKVWITNI